VTLNSPIVLNILSWGACLLLLWGLKLVGEKKRHGFYFSLVAEALWILWGVETKAWALVVMSLWICGMYFRALALWGKSG
jgi:hypothetical protein